MYGPENNEVETNAMLTFSKALLFFFFFLKGGECGIWRFPG